MEISNAHHQAMASHQLDQVLAAISYQYPHHHHHHQHEQSTQPQQQQQQQQQVVVVEKKAAARPHPNPEQALRCPRCDSTNTKFCYYNNYSLSQPRYFCKGCRRYWTHGGSLRNVPVGGGCRKNRRSSSSSSNSKKSSQPLITAAPVITNDLSLAFAANPNPNPAAGLLDILNGYTNLNSGHYVDQTTGGIGTTSVGTTAAAAGSLDGYWIDHGSNIGVGSYWQGLANSSLI